MDLVLRPNKLEVLNSCYTAYDTNMEILNKKRRERKLLRTIEICKIHELDHIMRILKYHVAQMFQQGKIEGRLGVSLYQLSWLTNIRQWTGTVWYGSSYGSPLFEVGFSLNVSKLMICPHYYEAFISAHSNWFIVLLPYLFFLQSPIAFWRKLLQVFGLEGQISVYQVSDSSPCKESTLRILNKAVDCQQFY